MSEQNSEILTNVSSDRMLRQAEIQAIRQLSDSISVLNGRLHDMGMDVKDARDRLIAMESSGLDRKLTEYRTDMMERLVTVKQELENEIDERKANDKATEGRLLGMDKLLTKYGLALAIIGTVGGTSLGIVLQKLFGIH